MRGGLFAAYFRTLVMAVLIWILADRAADLSRELVPAAWRFWIVTEVLPNDISALLADLRRSAWPGVFAALGASYALEQSELPRGIQRFFLPPLPDFLVWPGRTHALSPWRRKMRFVGRHGDRASLRSFLADRRPGVLAYGLHGPRGVGKTRFIIEVLGPLRPGPMRPWRYLRPWHVGRLDKAVPLDAQFRRPTAILVNYSEDAEVFWQSTDVLLNDKHAHPIRLIFESSVDFELMVEGRADHKVAKLRATVVKAEQPADVPTIAAPKVARDSANTRDARLVPLRSVADEVTSERLLSHPPADQETRTTAVGGAMFRHLAPLSGEEERLLLHAAIHAYRPRFPRWSWWREEVGARRARRDFYPSVVRRSVRGRPHYAAHVISAIEDEGPVAAIRAFANRRGIDLWMVPREDAELLIEEAVAAFPEEGLKLLLFAALAQGVPLSALERNRYAPGSSDRRRLSRVFENDLDKEAPGSDLLYEAPSISDAEKAHHTLMMVIPRLQQPDIIALAEKAARLSSAFSNALYRRLADILQSRWPPVDNSPARLRYDHPSIYSTMIASLLLLGREPRMLRALGRRLREEPFFAQMRERRGPPDLPDRTDEIVAIEGLAALTRHMLPEGQTPNSSSAAALVGAIVAHGTAMMEHASPEVRAEILDSFARLTTSLRAEVALLASSPNWRSSRRLIPLLKLLFDPPYLSRRTSDEAEWLYSAIRPPLDTETADDETLSEQDAAIQGFEVMDRAFRASVPEPWTEVEEALIERLLRGSDRVGQMAATWAAYWYVRPTEIEASLPISEGIEKALWALVNSLETHSVVWKRAAASIAKICLPSAARNEDLLLLWARWVDGHPKGLNPGRVTEKVTVGRSTADSRIGFDRACRVLADTDYDSDVRRAAALLALACRQDVDVVPQGVIQALVDAVRDPTLVQQQHEAFLIRLAQIDSPDAAEAVARFVRKYPTDAGTAAFLALGAMGKMDQIDLEELSEKPGGDHYTAAWRRLRGRVGGADTAAAPVTQDEDSLPAPAGSGYFEKQLIRVRGHQIHKLKARDTTGAWAYYFVLIKPQGEAAFSAAIEGDGTIDLEDYGEVIASSYGEEPSPEVRDFLKAQYGFDV